LFPHPDTSAHNADSRSVTATAFALAIAAAALHASWNLVVKASGDRLVAAAAQAVFGAVAFLPFLAIAGWPRGGVTAAVASSFCHVAYYLGLVRSYRATDLSVAYPVARGTAPLLVAVGSVVFVDDELTALAWLGIVVVSASLLSIGLHVRDLTNLAWPLATGAVIATYTLIDAHGIRATGERLAYVSLLFALTPIWLVPLVVRRRGTSAVGAAVRRDGWRLAVAGVASVRSYTLVLLAASRAAVGPVAAVRETSVVFAVLGSRLLLGEDVGHRRVLGAVGVACGAVVLAFA
jgi:drug/metabolite transporter (DMT)-like permease